MQTSRKASLRQLLIGDRAFYRMVLLIVLPLILQNAVSNFVNLLDNLMVGRIGTDPMTGVSIVNQLMFVFNLCVFGGQAGAGIFAAQFHGAGSAEGVRHCFRFKLYLSAALTLGAILLFSIAGEPLIHLYLNDADAAARAEQTLAYGRSYLSVMLWGLLPFALSQTYSGTLREVGETRVPMVASIIAVFMNLILNYLLIYGHLCFPAMGVSGAALATCISRYAELAIVAVYTHTHPDRYRFIIGAYASPKIPMKLVKQIAVKGAPLLVNEALWSSGIAMITQSYSVRGIDVVSALNITSTASNLFNVVFLSMGSATGIVIGQALGARRIDDAKRYVWWLAAFSIMLAGCTALVMVFAAPLIPRLYNTEEGIRALATSLLYVCCAAMPIQSFANTAYFTIRSGGKTLITFFFDCGFTWVVSLPLAFLLTRFTALPIVTCYLIVTLADLLKCAVAWVLIRRGIWINVITV